MHQPSEQLSLFTFEADRIAPISIPKTWHKIYRSWRGDFQVIRQRQIGRSKVLNYDIYIEIYDPDGNWETVVEITTPQISVAQSEFYGTVDRLENAANSLALNNYPSVSESLVASDTNDSLTLNKYPSVSESLVVSDTNDSLT